MKIIIRYEATLPNCMAETPTLPRIPRISKTPPCRIVEGEVEIKRSNLLMLFNLA